MRRLSDRVTVSGQIRPDDVAGLAAAGVRRLINNRPDGEEPGQPDDATLRLAAEAVGLTYVSAPFRGPPTPAAVAAMAEALENEGLIHAFCRSGSRSSWAWALAEARRGRPVEEIIQAGREAGYDLASLFF